MSFLADRPAISSPKQAMQLKALLKSARLKRLSLIKDLKCYRLFHGKFDGLMGLVIDDLNGIFVIQTSSKATDSLLPELVRHLSIDFSATAVVLKNNHKERLKKNLVLTDEILFGSIADDTLCISEFGQNYRYNILQDKDLFPLLARHLRCELNLQLAQNKNASVLLIGFTEESLISAENFSDVKNKCSIITEDKNLSEINGNLRRHVAEKEISYEMIVIKNPVPPGLIANKTGLFHFYLGVFKALTASGQIFIETQNWPALKKILIHAAKKSKRKLKIVNLWNDFVDCPNTSLKAHQKKACVQIKVFA